MPNCIKISYPKFKFRKKGTNVFTKIKPIRIDIKEYDLIVKISKQLGISPNYFIRWCSYRSAVCIAKQSKNRKKYDTI